MFFINLYTTIDRFLIRTRVKYPETLKRNNFKSPRLFFFFIWHIILAWVKGLLYQFSAIFAIFQCYSSSSLILEREGKKSLHSLFHLYDDNNGYFDPVYKKKKCEITLLHSQIITFLQYSTYSLY
jgi:hypothetical protein